MKKFIFLWSLCFLALGMQFLVAQEDNSEVKKAVQLLKNNQIEEATKIFLRHQENSQALYYLGIIYSEKLILADLKKSFEFYKKSKEKNHVLAQTQYALYFLTDEFVKKDLDQAVRLFTNKTLSLTKISGFNPRLKQFYILLFYATKKIP